MGEACTLARDATGQRRRSACPKVKLEREVAGGNTRLYCSGHGDQGDETICQGRRGGDKRDEKGTER